jgi:8-oxo-dGTP pyrophosphatase MutT (NUDIX family)
MIRKEVAVTLKPWEIISTEQEESYRVFSLRIDKARSPRTGQTHSFFILDTPAWVNLIPITPQGQVVLIRQYRHGIREITLEIPGGLVESGDSPQAAAERELHEETGYRATEIYPLGYVHPNPAIQNNRCYTFVARGVFPGGRQQQDEKEDIEVLLQPLEKIPRLIRNGVITHALVLAAFYRFFMENEP